MEGRILKTPLNVIHNYKYDLSYTSYISLIITRLKVTTKTTFIGFTNAECMAEL